VMIAQTNNATASTTSAAPTQAAGTAVGTNGQGASQPSAMPMTAASAHISGGRTMTCAVSAVALMACSCWRALVGLRLLEREVRDDADALLGVELLHAECDDTVALVDAAGDHDVLRVIGFHGDRLQRDLSGLGVDHEQRGPSALVEQGRQRQPGNALTCSIAERQRRGHAELDVLAGAGQRKLCEIGAGGR